MQRTGVCLLNVHQSPKFSGFSEASDVRHRVIAGIINDHAG